MKKAPESFARLTESLEALPGMGKKSALRIAYHLVCNDQFLAHKLSHAIEEALQNVRRCNECHNISEHELCEICADEFRDSSKLMLVASPKDILTIEESGGYNGRYFVLEHTTADTIAQLQHTASHGAKELIFAFTPSIASDALILLIEDKLSNIGVSFTKIAQGVPTGVNFENIDTLSIARAIESRVKA